MKKLSLPLLLTATMLMTACQNETNTPESENSNPNSIPIVEETPDKLKPDFIEGEDYDEDGGADAYQFAGDNSTSRFYVNPDFYRLTSDETLTIIPKFKTMQQTTEWSCGNAVSLMTLVHMGKTDLTEWDLAVAMGSALDEDTDGS